MDSSTDFQECKYAHETSGVYWRGQPPSRSVLAVCLLKYQFEIPIDAGAPPIGNLHYGTSWMQNAITNENVLESVSRLNTRY